MTCCPHCHQPGQVELDDALLDTVERCMVYRWRCRACGRRWATH